MKNVEVSTGHVAQYIAQLNKQEGEDVEKILVRRVGPTIYGVQVWLRGEREPEAYFLSLKGSLEDSPSATDRSASSRGSE